MTACCCRSRQRRDALCCVVVLFFLVVLGGESAAAERLELQSLIDEALRQSPEVAAAEARAGAARFKVPQAKSLPDPMFMVGYQNEGFSRYTYGETLMSAWMFSASQMFPFPGKLGLKEAIASADADTLTDMVALTKLRISARVKELYYDLFLAYKDIDLIGEQLALYEQIENASVARYAAGKGTQQEVIMSQAGKYLLREKEEMSRQRIQSAEAMLNATLGRGVNSPLGRPAEPVFHPYEQDIEALLAVSYERSPEIRARSRMVRASETAVRLAQKEYYPDFTVSAEYDKKGGPYMDMWALKTAVNIPLYYRTKQRQGVYEAESALAASRGEFLAAKLSVASAARDRYSMIMSGERLMDLYRNALIPNARRDFDSSLSEYATGGTGAAAVISKLGALLEYETSYWRQFADREKAIARLMEITGADDGEGAAK